MKLYKVILGLGLLLFMLAGCSPLLTLEELYITGYPMSVPEGEKFTVKGEYLTELPDKYQEVEVFLAVIIADTEQIVYQDKKTIKNRSQPFSFSEIEIDSMEAPVFFELKLVADGKYLMSVDTADSPSVSAGWRNNIVTTYFKGEGKNTWGFSLEEGNQYFFALPYRDFYYFVDGDKEENLTDKDYYGVSDVKNRWIEIYYPENASYVYAQWRDVGPWNYYDPHYVFEGERPYAEIGIDMGWLGYYRETNKAGLDISPEAMRYLTGQESHEEPRGIIETNWRFIDENEVPDGPWKEEVSTREARPEIFNLETESLKNIE